MRQHTINRTRLDRRYRRACRCRPAPTPSPDVPVNPARAAADARLDAEWAAWLAAHADAGFPPPGQRLTRQAEAPTLPA